MLDGINYLPNIGGAWMFRGGPYTPPQKTRESPISRGMLSIVVQLLYNLILSIQTVLFLISKLPSSEFFYCITLYCNITRVKTALVFIIGSREGWDTIVILPSIATTQSAVKQKWPLSCNIWGKSVCLEYNKYMHKNTRFCLVQQRIHSCLGW